MPATVSRSSSRRGDTSRCAHPERLREAPRQPLAEAGQRALTPGLPGHGGHPDVIDAARHDPLERLKVVVHVHGEPVRGHAARDPHADRGDLRVGRPHARERRVAHLGRDALVAERGHDRTLHRVHEVGHPLHGHDRVGHELSGAVVGHAPAAVRVADLDALGAVPVLAHRQVARARCACPSCTRAGARARAGGPEARRPGGAREASPAARFPPGREPSRAAPPRVQPRDEGYSPVQWIETSASGPPASAGGCAGRGCGPPSSPSRCSTV